METFADDRGSLSGDVPPSAVASSESSSPSSTTTAVMVSLYPDLRPEEFVNDASLNFTFVVDRSGSMGGWKMDSAKRTLQLCLRSLPEGSLFQIVSFGSSYEKLFPAGSAVYDEATLAQAATYVTRMEADMGTGAHGVSCSGIDTRSGALFPDDLCCRADRFDMLLQVARRSSSRSTTFFLLM